MFPYDVLTRSETLPKNPSSTSGTSPVICSEVSLGCLGFKLFTIQNSIKIYLLCQYCAASKSCQIKMRFYKISAILPIMGKQNPCKYFKTKCSQTKANFSLKVYLSKLPRQITL